MSSFRVGTDIVSVERVGRLVQRRGGGFLSRWFTKDEISYCLGKADPAQHFAARLAAKESVVKALRLPWDGPIPYRSVEITHDPHGAPVVQLSGRVQQAAARAGLQQVEISLSHCREHAVAVAMTSSAGMMHPGGEDS